MNENNVYSDETRLLFREAQDVVVQRNGRIGALELREAFAKKTNLSIVTDELATIAAQVREHFDLPEWKHVKQLKREAGTRAFALDTAVTFWAANDVFHFGRSPRSLHRDFKPHRDAGHRMLFQRMALKTAVGLTYRDEVSEALDALRIERFPEFHSASDDESHRNLIANYDARVQEHLAAKDGAKDDRSAYFDPLAWNVSQLPINGQHSRFARLAIYTNGVLQQEAVLEEMGVTDLHAAETAAMEMPANAAPIRKSVQLGPRPLSSGDPSPIEDVIPPSDD